MTARTCNQNAKVRNPLELDGVLIQYRRGASVEVDFYRGDALMSVTAILGKRPG